MVDYKTEHYDLALTICCDLDVFVFINKEPKYSNIDLKSGDQLKMKEASLPDHYLSKYLLSSGVPFGVVP